MTRRALTEEENYCNAKHKINEILQQHTLDFIKGQRAEYNRLRRLGITDTTLRRFNNLYKTFERLRKFIVEYEL